MNTRKDKESSPIPPPESLFLLPSLKAPSRSSRFLLSHSEASLAAVVAKKSRSVWLHRSSANSSAILVRSLPRVGSGSFLVSSKTVVQRVFVATLAFPLRAVPKQMLMSLDLILAPPTAGVRASSGPRKVLSCQAVPRLLEVLGGTNQSKTVISTR